MRASCVICSDFFDEINPISSAACGHVYHSSCLSLWIGQSQSCPQCRSRVTQRNVQRLYFNFPPSSTSNSSDLENEVENLKSKLSEKNIELQTIKKEKEEIAAYVRLAEKKSSELQQAAYKNESEISELRLRVKSLAKVESKLLKLEQMNVALTNDLQHLNNVQTIVNGTQKDVENILQEYNNGSEATKQLATYCTCLKRELQKVIESKSKLVELNSELKRENCHYAAKVKFYEDAMAISENSNKSVKKNSIGSFPKSPLTNIDLNDSPYSNKPSCSGLQNSSKEINISPLTVPFNKPKFNLCITSKITYRKDSGNQDDRKLISVPSLSKAKLNDNSIVRTGYNGLGGHSNFINVSTGIKKVKSLKRKV